MKSIVYSILLAGLLNSCSKNETKDKSQNTSIQSPADIATNLVVATGRVEPDKEIIALSAPDGGIVKSIQKNEGDIVSPGDLLVQLENALEQSKINEIKAAIETQLNRVEIEKTKVSEIQTNIAYKTQLLEKAKRLVSRGAETQQIADDLETEVKLLKVKSIEAQLQIQLAQYRINELKTQLKTASIEQSKKLFYAPVAGQLLKLTVKPGGSVSKYDVYAEFAPAGDYIVKAEVDELFAAKIKSGQKVDVVNTGSSTVITTGEVYYVAPYLKKKSLFSEKTDEQEDRRVREIKIRLNNDEGLLINSKVECKIKL